MQDRQLQQQRQQQQRRQQQQQHLRQEGEAVLPPPAQPSQVDPQVLFFNRIHKTGSTNFAAMMERMAGRNGFEHKRSGYYPDIKFVNRDEQVEEEREGHFPFFFLYKLSRQTTCHLPNLTKKIELDNDSFPIF